MTETLAYFVGATGNRQALVAFPQSERGSHIAGMLSHYGFDADLVTTGRELFQRASRSADYQMLLISDATVHPTASELIQSLRRDPV